MLHFKWALVNRLNQTRFSRLFESAQSPEFILKTRKKPYELLKSKSNNLLTYERYVGGANLLPGAILHMCANLHKGANFAYKRGFRNPN